MAIVPVVNSGTTPQVRRPRVTISEGSAVSGPFPIALQCTAANKFRPGPNDITVLSSRLAITANATAPQTFPWGDDYGVSDNIGTTPVPVGYLWIRSIDANADGYDDLEVDASATIAQAFSVYSDNLVTINPNAMSGVGAVNLYGSGAFTSDNPLAGVGAVNLYGSGAFTSDNPLAGVGELLLSGEGTFIVAGMWSGEGEITFDGSGSFVANNPMAGTGLIELAGSGAMTALNPLGQVTGFSAEPGDTMATLGWNAHTAVTGLGYTVERVQQAGNPGTGSWSALNGYTSANVGNVTSLTTGIAAGLTNGLPYWFRVRATADGYIDGAWSAADSVTPEATSSSLSGTYYFRNAQRSGGLTGDYELGESNTSTQIDFTSSARGTCYLQAQIVRLDSSGSIVGDPIIDWTNLGATITANGNDTNRSNSGSPMSFSDPSVGATDYFAVRLRLQDSIHSNIVVTTPYFTLPQGTNSGAQSSVVVSAWACIAWWDEDSLEYVTGIMLGNTSFATTIAFGS